MFRYRNDAIEDCDGKCMENANSLLEMFMYNYRYGIDDIWWIFNVKNSITNKRTITMIKVSQKLLRH